MRVLFSSTRGAGHFTPLVPYIDACLRRGHDVSVAGPEDIVDAVTRTGATFRPFGHPGDETLRPVWSRLAGASYDEANAIVVGEIFATLNAQASLPELERTFREWRPDICVRETAEFGAAVVSEKFAVPQVRVGISLACLEDMSLRVAAAPIDELRRRIGLSPGGDAEWLRKSPYFTVMPLSFEDPAALAQPDTHRFREPRVEQAMEPLPEWWENRDDPLVYVTFGSVAGSMPMARAAYRAALDAVAELPLRALLTTGIGADPHVFESVPPNVHVEQWVPHYQVLEHAAAVVCHGGSGTVLGTLAAKKPLVVVPLFADQPQNAARVAATGAGIVVEPGSGMRQALLDAIPRVLRQPNIREAAVALGVEMQAQAPMNEAVDALERMVERPS